LTFKGETSYNKKDELIKNLEECNDLQGMVVDDLIKLLKFKNLEKNLQAKMYERDIEEETEED
jgi:inorganic pyrophosphatase